MIVLASTAGDVAYYALAIFLVAVGLGTAFMLFKLGQAFGRMSSFISGSERDLLPVIVKTGGTVDRINYQLDKADSITDSAVAMADSADTAVRAVSHAVATPVKKVSGLAAGVSHGVSTFRAKRDFGEAMRTAREAAARREASTAAGWCSTATPASTCACRAAPMDCGRAPKPSPGRRSALATCCSSTRKASATRTSRSTSAATASCTHPRAASRSRPRA